MKNSVLTGIELSPLMQEWEAAHAAGLNLYDWESGKYDTGFKARVIAWHSRHTELDLHRQDAVNRAKPGK